MPNPAQYKAKLESYTRGKDPSRCYLMPATISEFVPMILNNRVWRMMQIMLSFVLTASSVLTALASGRASAEEAHKCLYNDEHFHIQDFKADGPPIAEISKMMDDHVCRSTLMGLAVTVAHDPLIDRDFAPVYYTQTDGQVMYYNAIQDVLVAHKFLALPKQGRARVDPLMSAFNLKGARAGDYIRKMVHLYPGVWSGFGEIHFKKQEFSEKIAGGPPSLYSPSIDAIFDVIGEMGAVVHCDHDTPYNLALRNDPGARMIFNGKSPQRLSSGPTLWGTVAMSSRIRSIGSILRRCWGIQLSSMSTSTCPGARLSHLTSSIHHSI
jgi:hypothetical protein